LEAVKLNSEAINYISKKLRYDKDVVKIVRINKYNELRNDNKRDDPFLKHKLAFINPSSS